MIQMADYRTIYDLMLAVARHLSGHPDLILRMNRSPVDGHLATTYKNSEGVLTIVVPGGVSLDVFLHEVGHARLHKFIPVDETQLISKQASGPIQKVLTKIREDQATDQARRWIDYGRSHQAYDDEDILWELMRWRE